MNTKPSPAPWHIEDRAAPEGTVIVCPDGVSMRLIVFYGQSPIGGTYSDGITIAQYKANLRCMAASAEMLETLKKIVNSGAPSCADSYSEEGVEYEWNRDVRDPALAAIFRATGEHYTPSE